MPDLSRNFRFCLLYPEARKQLMCLIITYNITNNTVDTYVIIPWIVKMCVIPLQVVLTLYLLGLKTEFYYFNCRVTTGVCNNT